MGSGPLKKETEGTRISFAPHSHPTQCLRCDFSQSTKKVEEPRDGEKRQIFLYDGNRIRKSYILLHIAQNKFIIKEDSGGGVLVFCGGVVVVLFCFFAHRM